MGDIRVGICACRFCCLGGDQCLGFRRGWALVVATTTSAAAGATAATARATSSVAPAPRSVTEITAARGFARAADRIVIAWVAWPAAAGAAAARAAATGAAAAGAAAAGAATARIAAAKSTDAHTRTGPIAAATGKYRARPAGTAPVQVRGPAFVAMALHVTGTNKTWIKRDQTCRRQQNGEKPGHPAWRFLSNIC